MPARPVTAKPGKQSKAAKKAEELARKQEEERIATLLEEERLQIEQIEREEELKRLADEKRLVCMCEFFLDDPSLRHFLVHSVAGTRRSTLG